MSEFVRMSSAASIAIDRVPLLSSEGFTEVARAVLGAGGRMAALVGIPEQRVIESAPPDQLRLIAVLAQASEHALLVFSTVVAESFPSLTEDFPQVHRFEREIFEQWGVTPQGHPWLKPVRFERPLRPVPSPATSEMRPGVTDFFRVGGSEIHEVAVGPVHAGIIEPGHFRFQCHGEHVYHLEIALGYQHRGVERALLGGPNVRTCHYIETLAGDTSCGHAWAHALVDEALAGVAAAEGVTGLRAVALELERLANHVGDLGALAGDVAFLPTASFCGRIRGDVLNMTALLCGNRFGRGLIIPGGSTVALEASRRKELLQRLAAAESDVRSAVELLFKTPSVLTRFEGTGTLDAARAQVMGVVGVAARAAGLARDVRRDFPVAHDPYVSLEVQTAETGDVNGRAQVRFKEVQASLGFLNEILSRPGEWAPTLKTPTLRSRRLAVALVEGWRGEICHVAVTDKDGRYAIYKVVDPSFHNWAGLAHAMRDQAISDFPLCNKSFNLSYCGQDL